MNVVLAMLAVVGAAGVLYGGVLVLASRKGICPGCRARGLESDPNAGHLGTAVNDRGERYPYSLSAYRCVACGAEWREYNNNGLVPKEAYDAGAREPIPTATLGKPEPDR
jgi:hypothetical protein